MPIPLLPQNAYLGFLETLASPGVELSQIARVRFPDGPRRAYCKLYPPNSLGLANELTGHLLGQALGLAVPSRAAVLMVPNAAVPSPPAWLRASPHPATPAWCTQDMATPSIRFVFDLRAPAALAAVRAELLASGETPHVVAFDDWIANTDRNLGNLLRLGKGRYLLIDHGHALGGPAWMPTSLLRATREFANTLRRLLSPAATTPAFTDTLADCCRQHAAALDQARPELLHWWDLLLSRAEHDAARAFLVARASEALICQRYGLLL